MSNKILGIYGDSFGNLNLGDAHDEMGLSWIDELSNILNTTNTTNINNHASSGFSLMQIYESYINTKHLNNFNIFIIPTLDRMYFPNLDKMFEKIGHYNWYANYNTVNIVKAQVQKMTTAKTQYEQEHKIIDSVIAYFEYWKNTDSEILLNKTFALDLINNTKNTVFLYTDGKLFDGRFSLFDLSLWETDQLPWHNRKSYNTGHIIAGKKCLMDARKNHLSEENSIILAHKIHESILRKEKIVHLNLSDFVVPSKSFDFYYRWGDI